MAGPSGPAFLYNFYPRSPCGERLPIVPAELVTLVFLSTLSLRRATRGGHINETKREHFYPRSPCGERLAYPDMIICTNVISIHALLAESDAPRPCYCSMGGHISIHALLAESDPTYHAYTMDYPEFLSTLSLRRATLRRGT